MEAAGLDRFRIGLVAGIGSALAFFVQPVLGRLSDRLDARRPFICGTAFAAGLAYLAFPYTNGLVPFLLLSAVGATGTGYLQTAGGVLVGRMVQASAGGAAYANLRVWGSVGYIVTSLGSGWLVGSRATGREGLNPVFTYGPLLFFVIALVAWALPDRKSAGDEPPAGKAPLPDNLKRFLLAYFLYIFALYGASGFLSIYMKSLGASGPWITGMVAAGVVVEVLVMRWSGRFSDRYGRRPALAVSFLLLPVRMLLYIPATGPGWMLAVQSLHGINFGIVGAVAVAFANDLATERTRGHAQARLFAAAGLAGAFSPVVFGAVAHRYGLHAMFAVSAGVAAFAAIVLIFGVDDSHPESHSLAARVPGRLGAALGWLDAPPRRAK